MKQRRRIYYSERQRALMWERWRAGESLQHIAQLFDRNHSSVPRILAQTGEIQPPPRRRSKRSLTLAECEEISRGLAAEDSIQTIARRLSRAPSTICRRSSATAATKAIGPTPPMGSPGSGPCARRRASWSRHRRWQKSWRQSCNWNGRRSRSPDGSSEQGRTARVPTCHTKRSIEPCSFKHAAR